MKFIFVHHQPHGPFTLEALWNGTHGFAGSVAHLRILFWLASRGNEVYLIGNVHNGVLGGVRAIAGLEHVHTLCQGCSPAAPSVVVLNHFPDRALWRVIRQNPPCPIVVWANNPFDTRWLKELQKGNIARIVCLSHYDRERYRIYPGFQAVEMTYSGVDLDLMEKAPARTNGHNVVLFCPVPRRTKGVHNLLRAWPFVRKGCPDARLRICGSARMHDPHAPLGPAGVLDRDVEEEFSELLGTPERRQRWGISLLGTLSLPQIYSEMKGATVAVVNCNWRGSFDTFSRAAVEAQSAGAPVVGAKRGALPEVVADGRTGLLVNRADPKALAEAIITLLRNKPLRDTMAAAAPSWARPFADYNLLAADWEAIARRAWTGENAPSPRRRFDDFLRSIGYGSLRRTARNLIRGTSLERLVLRFYSGR
ncbi:MAG: glycosyltransferase family 4 protein [Dehalococcoidia bacterium]|nr:glycosyltransferase family 4 protein [Dehalococcoidia bacterium]MDW8119903.1 glycosyltransferase family 4 protein [Chloroflexota bacterium]